MGRRPAPVVLAGRPLSPREREVLGRVALLETNVEIGEHLGIRPETVKTHLFYIYRKLDVRTRRGAVRRLRAERAMAQKGDD